MLACGEDAAPGDFADMGARLDGAVDMARSDAGSRDGGADVAVTRDAGTDGSSAQDGAPADVGIDAVVADAVVADAVVVDARMDVAPLDSGPADMAPDMPIERCEGGQTRPCAEGCAVQQTCSDGEWLPCDLPSETCNGLDDDCDGNTDEAGADCHPDAACTETPAGPACVCGPGLQGDGQACEDLDECFAQPDICGFAAECSNRLGGYDCACPFGFTAQDDGGCLCERRLAMFPPPPERAISTLDQALGEGSFSVLHAWDANDDGDSDLLVVGGRPLRLFWLRNEGNRLFEVALRWDVAPGIDLNHVHVAEEEGGPFVMVGGEVGGRGIHIARWDAARADFSFFQRYEVTNRDIEPLGYADFDGDGTQDVFAIAREVDAQLWWLRGTADGFSPARQVMILPQGLRAADVRLFDVDLDAQPDFTYHEGNEVIWFRNRGAVLEGPAVLLDAGLPIERMEVADLDDVPGLDLVWRTNNGSEIYGARNQGGQFEALGRISDGRRLASRGWAVGPVTNDNRPGVLASNGSNLVLMPGVDGRARGFSVNAALDIIEQVLLIPSNTHLEAAMVFGSNPARARLVRLLRDELLPFGRPLVVDDPDIDQEGTTASLYRGDWNGDGLDDLLESRNGVGGRIYLHQARPEGGVRAGTYLGVNSTIYGVGEINGDGRLDLLGSSAGHPAWFGRAGDEPVPITHVIDAASPVNHAYLADVDTDDDLDVVVLRRADPGAVVWYQNDGRGAFQGPLEIFIAQQGSVESWIAEVEPGGGPDVVVNQGTEWWVMANDGRGIFARRASIISNNSMVPSDTVPLVDVDHDGHLDLVLFNGPSIIWHRNDPDRRTWEPARELFPHTLRVNDDHNWLVAADLDADARTDLIYGGEFSGFVYFRRGLDGAAFGEEQLITDRHIGAIVAVPMDVDRDGSLDMVVGGRELSWYPTEPECR
jgi:hypothetical protein